MSRYARGRELEYEVAGVLRAAGWAIVRGAGSKGDFAFPDAPDGVKSDLVASKLGRTNIDEIHILLLQAKRKRRKGLSKLKVHKNDLRKHRRRIGERKPPPPQENDASGTPDAVC